MAFTLDQAPQQSGFKLDQPGFKLDSPGLFQRAEAAAVDLGKKALNALNPPAAPTSDRLRVSEPPQPGAEPAPSPATVGADLKRFQRDMRQQARESTGRVKSAVEAVGEPVTAGVSRADEAARKAYDDWLTAHPGDQKGAFNAMLEASRAAGGMSAAANIGISMGGGEPIKPPFKPPPLTELFIGKPKTEAGPPNLIPDLPAGYTAQPRFYKPSYAQDGTLIRSGKAIEVLGPNGESIGILDNVNQRPPWLADLMKTGKAKGVYQTAVEAAEKEGDPQARSRYQRLATESEQPIPAANAPETAGEKIGRMAGLAADRDAEARGERVPGSPARSFESIARDEVHAKQPSAKPIRDPVTGEPGPILDAPKEAETPKQFAMRIDDGLNRLRGYAEADRNDARKSILSQPRETLDPAFQAKAYGEIEQRMIDPKAEFSEDVEAFNNKIKPLRAEENKLGSEVRALLGKDADLVGLPTYEQGYVHRIRAGVGHYLDRGDPARAQQADPITGTTRGLTRKASSMQPRTMVVIEDAQGNRSTPRPLPDGWKLGQNVAYDNAPGGGVVKHATTEEIESQTPLRYHKNVLINTWDNVLKLRRVKRNLEFLNGLKPELQNRGLWYPRGQTEQAPRNYVRVDVPALEGVAHPSIAHTINDLVGHRDLNALLDGLAKVNNFLTRTIFIQPVGHIANVMQLWYTGRGWEWLKPTGYYSIAKNGTRAIKSVISQDALQQRLLREGAGLKYAGVANQNFYKMMIEKAGGEMMRDPRWAQIANQLGLGVPKLVQALYRTSSKALWAANDIFLTQRILELTDRGLDIRSAIQKAEQEIPNYRVPSEVLGTRWLSQAIRSPNITMFGRYHYDIFKTYANMIKPFLKGTAEEKADAAGKLLALGVMAFAIYPYADNALSKLFGKGTKEQRYGLLTIPYAVLEFAQDTRDWQAMVSTAITPAPVLRAGTQALSGRDDFGRPIINPQSSTLGKGVQLGEFAANQISPLQQATQALKPGGAGRIAARQVGIKIPNPAAEPAKKKGEKIERAEAKSRERRDTIEQFIRRALP